MDRVKQIELWVPIKGYETYYEVSTLGRVKSLERRIPHGRYGTQFVRERIRKAPLDSRGYHQIQLSKNGVLRPFLVHHLVAIAYLPERQPGQEINHKNGNKTDNRVLNLEWVTKWENLNHALTTGLASKPRWLIGCSNGCEYKSICEASRILGLPRSSIYKCVLGQQKSVKGYTFRRLNP